MANMTHEQAMQVLRDLQNIRPIMASLDEVIPNIANLLNKSQEAQDFLMKAYHQLDQKKATVEADIAAMEGRKTAAERGARDAEGKTLTEIAKLNEQTAAVKAKLKVVTEALDAQTADHHRIKSAHAEELSDVQTQIGAAKVALKNITDHIASLKAKFA